MKRSITVALVFSLLAAATVCAQQQQPPVIAPPQQPATHASQPTSSPQTQGATQTQTSTSSPQNNEALQASSSTSQSSSVADERYRIGAGDVLELRVLRAPELSREAIRVDQRGMIRIPMIDYDVPASCRTENELAQQIATIYLRYKRNPHVDVFVKEYQSKPVAVIGAVTQPGRFQMQRRIRLLELMSYVNGPTEHAGRTINVIHAGVINQCDAGAVNEQAEDTQSFAAYKLSDMLRGDPAANPFISPGDIITVPEAEQAYVVGNVARPTNIPLREPVSVTRAIAIAGGTLRDTRTDRVRIVRQLPGSNQKTEILVDLRAISRQRAEDVLLQPNDIVEVQESGSKSFLRSLLGTIAPAVSQLPIRVIP
ncbi:MAG TPA: polysaccharide biosynthesis/export family protein [Pyrinomonadaceae bacterium]|nr:polysaccharide biosynthesis/export family protein [Pyrinomonadaceae bacterium]